MTIIELETGHTFHTEILEVVHRIGFLEFPEQKRIGLLRDPQGTREQFYMQDIEFSLDAEEAAAQALNRLDEYLVWSIGSELSYMHQMHRFGHL